MNCVICLCVCVCAEGIILTESHWHHWSVNKNINIQTKFGQTSQTLYKLKSSINNMSPLCKAGHAKIGFSAVIR